MTTLPQARMLPDGRRLHLQHGPIDLIVEAFGSVEAVADAYWRAVRRFDGLLEALCDEIALLRRPFDAARAPAGPVARRMWAAVRPFATDVFITPMAAVAGAVADEILDVLLSEGDLERAYVNNGGDIAAHCAAGQRFTIGMIDRPDRPGLFGQAAIDAASGVHGIATSGWRGRSFSLGIADAVTVLARSAADADAAATVIANAVDLPGHPAVTRVPADSLQPDSDLGARLVTRAVGALDAEEIAAALNAGLACAEDVCRRDLIVAASLHLQSVTRVVDARPAKIQAGRVASRDELGLPSHLAGEGGAQRRMRDSHCPSVPSSGLASLGHLLPRGEKESWRVPLSRGAIAPVSPTARETLSHA